MLLKPAFLATLVSVATLPVTDPALALPSGRAWTPASTLTLPGIRYLAAPRIDIDSLGGPTLLGLERASGSRDLDSFLWEGTDWALKWKLGEGTLFAWPVMSPPGTNYLVWGGAEEWSTRVLSLARIFAGGIAEPETVTLTVGAQTEYSAAVGPRRRWAAVSDSTGRPSKRLRVFYSDTFRVWREVPVQGLGRYGVAVSTLDDTTALVAWADIDQGMGWGILRGTQWRFGGSLPRGTIPNRPRFRPRPSGGQWMAWGTSEPHVLISTFRDGAWSEPETLRCAYREAPYSQHFSGDPDLSRDDAEYPVIVWDAQYFGGSRICVCVPTDSGYGMAESLEGVPRGVLPSVARDGNGDVWVAWWEEFGPLRWQHSYTSAIAGPPRVVGAGRHRAVAWTLSEPAPGSWWTVLRARKDEPFEPVARVRAGSGTEMSWGDTSPPGGVLRYRIRRESVDKLYEWLSEEATWPPGSNRPRSPLLVSAGADLGSELQLNDAALGTIEVRVYDLQGRLVHRQTDVATPGGPKVFRLGLGKVSGALPSGIYFIRVRDALGRESNAVKTVVLR